MKVLHQTLMTVPSTKLQCFVALRSQKSHCLFFTFEKQQPRNKSETYFILIFVMQSIRKGNFHLSVINPLQILQNFSWTWWVLDQIIIAEFYQVISKDNYDHLFNSLALIKAMFTDFEHTFLLFYFFLSRFSLLFILNNSWNLLWFNFSLQLSTVCWLLYPPRGTRRIEKK